MKRVYPRRQHITWLALLATAALPVSLGRFGPNSSGAGAAAADRTIANQEGGKRPGVAEGQRFPFSDGKPFEMPPVTSVRNPDDLMILVLRGMEHNLSLLESFRVYTLWLIWFGLSAPEGNKPLVETLESVAPGRRVLASLAKRHARQTLLAVDGDRFRHEETWALPTFAPKNSQPYGVSAFDGVYMQSYDRESGSGGTRMTVERDSMIGVLWSLGLAYQSADPLPVFLRKHDAKVIGMSMVREEPCVVVDATGPGGSSLRFWIASEKGFLPLAIRSDGPKLTGDAGLYSARLCEFSQYRQFDNGAWLPMRYDFTSYRVMPEGKWKLNIKEVAIARSVEVELEFPDGYFQINFPIGTYVHDAIAERGYTVGGETKDLVENFDAYAAPARQAVTRRSSQATDGRLTVGQ